MSLYRKLIVPAVMTAALSVGAVPAKRDARTIIQPDGTTITIKRTGDEHMHFTLTDDDCLLVKNAEGVYHYAKLSADGSIVDTGRRAIDKSLRTTADEAFIQRIGSVEFETAAEARLNRTDSRQRAIAQTGLGLSRSSFPTTGDIRALVILVEYQDVKFTLSDPHTYFNELLNRDGFNQYGGTGCAAEYFRDQSSDKFRPVFDLFGPVTLPEPMAYYGGNDEDDDDLHPEMMAVHAAELLDSTVDFSKYDMDGDGLVDNIFIFYAGQGEASYGDENTVWPHAWTISSAHYEGNRVFDGVTINRYACTNEWEKDRPDGIGTFVHEFSHVMGLPDLYDTSGAGLGCTPGSWSVLDYGPYNNDGRTPPAYSIYERNAMGWIEPTVINGPASISLDPINETNQGYIIQTPLTNEFFLIENRQKTGWDEFIPGHGMLIWHIDYTNQSVFSGNKVNNDRTHQYVDIEEANGRTDRYNTTIMAGYSFPGTSGKTSFTDDTTPSMKTWNNERLNLPITNIQESESGVITFDVAGGASLMTPKVNEPSEVGGNYFVASWDAVDGATDYQLTVKAISDPDLNEVIESANMGTSSSTKAILPSGWTATTTEINTTTGFYGAAAPSLKLSKDQASLTTRTYDADIQGAKFWMKGISTIISGSKLVVEGYDGSEWKAIQSFAISNNVALDCTVENIPAGIKQMRFVFNRKSGNLALDDVTIRTASGTEIIYDGVSTNGATSMRVDRLKDGVNLYSYSVVAVDGTSRSSESASVMVSLDQSGIDNVDADALMTINVIGHDVICNGISADSVEIFDISGRMISHARVSGESAQVNVPSAGVYILRAGAVTRKLIIR